MKTYYQLADNVKIRRDGKGGIIMIRNGNDNFQFFYISEGLEKLLSLATSNSYLCLDPHASLNILTKAKFFNFISFLLASDILIHIADNEFAKKRAKKIVFFNKVPRLVYLFTTPTTHFRRYYDKKK